jgi:hypothetical protein
MVGDDIKDPAVRAFIINAAVHGLNTEIHTDEERRDFAIRLTDLLSGHSSETGIYAQGDEDGILLEDAAGTLVGLISVLDGIIKFRQLLNPDEIQPQHQTVLGRAILTTIGFTAAWHGDEAPQVVKPRGGCGIIHGGGEKQTTWDNSDGFGIT